MQYTDKARFDTLRSATAAQIVAGYTALGTALTHPAVAICFKNNTDGSVFISDDGVNDKLFLPANSFEIWDLRTNAPNTSNLQYPLGIQFYVKDGPTVAATGSVYLEILTVVVHT